MKLFDNRGKIFGVINILDLFLIVILVGALAFAGIKFLKTDDSPGLGSAGKQTVQYVLYNSNSHPFVLENVNVGDTIRHDETNSVLGTVVDIKIGEAKNHVTTADGRMLLSTVPDKEEIYLTIEGEANVANDVASIGPTQLLVGKQFSIKSSDYFFPVIISEVNIGK